MKIKNLEKPSNFDTNFIFYLLNKRLLLIKQTLFLHDTAVINRSEHWQQFSFSFGTENII